VDAGLDRLLAADFDPRTQAILETAPATSFPIVATRPAAPATVEYPSPTEAVVDVETPAPGILVLADACFAGWTAWIDGTRNPVRCANVLTRAGEVPAGRHRIRFAYRPAAVPAGCLVSLAGLAALALVVARGR